MNLEKLLTLPLQVFCLLNKVKYGTGGTVSLQCIFMHAFARRDNCRNTMWLRIRLSMLTHYYYYPNILKMITLYAEKHDVKCAHASITAISVNGNSLFLQSI